MLLQRERRVCPACGHPNSPSRHSRTRCRAPLPDGSRAAPSWRTVLLLLLVGLTAAALLSAGLFFGLLALGISPLPADLIIEIENRTGSTV